MGVVTDMTERKRANEERQALSRKLEESKARLEEAQRVAHIGHYEWNLIANRVTWSDELYRIYGLHPQEGPIDMAMVSEMIHPDDREHVFRAAEEAVRSGVHTEAEHRVVRPDGEVRTVQGLGTVKRDASGRAYEMFGTVQDITDRKRAEEALQRSQLLAIHPELEADTPKVLANRVQLQQVFMNLMLNAIEAMKDTGGELTIRSRVNPEGRLIVSIIDTGVGLPAGRSEQIFDPFHTTKPQGTGMGLTITRSIVESYGGRVWATVNQGAGATFHFTLPGETEAHV
jgi:PAS domain S-box-containing protein